MSDLSRILCWIRSCFLALLSNSSRVLCWIRKRFLTSSSDLFRILLWIRKCWCEFSRCFSGMKTPHYCCRTVYEGISPEFCSHRFYPLILIWMWNVSLSWDLFLMRFVELGRVHSSMGRCRKPPLPRHDIVTWHSICTRYYVLNYRTFPNLLVAVAWFYSLCCCVDEHTLYTLYSPWMYTLW